MSTLRVTIPGEPVPQGRAKVGRWKAKDERVGVTVRDPGRSVNWKGTAQVHMQLAMERAKVTQPFSGPLHVVIVAWFSCPKSDHRKRPVPARWHTKPGDADNLAKAVMDAGNAVLWEDDRQVCALDVRKLVAAQGEAPRVTITVETL